MRVFSLLLSGLAISTALLSTAHAAPLDSSERFGDLARYYMTRPIPSPGGAKTIVDALQAEIGTVELPVVNLERQETLMDYVLANPQSNLLDQSLRVCGLIKHQTPRGFLQRSTASSMGSIETLSLAHKEYLTDWYEESASQEAFGEEITLEDTAYFLFIQELLPVLNGLSLARLDSATASTCPQYRESVQTEFGVEFLPRF